VIVLTVQVYFIRKFIIAIISIRQKIVMFVFDTLISNFLLKFSELSKPTFFKTYPSPKEALYPRTLLNFIAR
jgi:hypothetical protein